MFRLSIRDLPVLLPGQMLNLCKPPFAQLPWHQRLADAMALQAGLSAGCVDLILLNEKSSTFGKRGGVLGRMKPYLREPDNTSQPIPLVEHARVCLRSKLPKYHLRDGHDLS